MSDYSIKDLEKLSGIKAHTIRIWEKRYNLVSPKRTATNIRYYSDEDLKKLLNISILNRNGVKISRIASLNNDQLHSQVNSVAREKWTHESQIESLIVAMIDLDEKRFDKLLSKNIIQMGFEDTILKVIYPFFQRIGLLWQTGNINPAQEHFVSNLVRQKIIVAIDSIISEDHPERLKFILFLPEGELHELALLFMYYLIKKRGHKVIYLGQSVPVNDVRDVQDLIGADYLITYFTSSIPINELNGRVENLSKTFHDTRVWIAGSQTDVLDQISQSNIKRISSPQELISNIS